MDSSSLPVDNTPTSASTPTPTPDKKPETRLTDVEVKNEIAALNLLVQFLGLAQKRGSFTIDEAAKIWECIKMFQKPV